MPWIYKTGNDGSCSHYARPDCSVAGVGSIWLCDGCGTQFEIVHPNSRANYLTIGSKNRKNIRAEWKELNNDYEN